jgi:hypothetical protein
MGQPIVVVEKPSVNRGIVRFETNRALTGMGHEHYTSGVEVRGNRPPDELARRLLDRDNVHGVHINGSVVTVDLAKGHTSEGLKEVIEDLYIFYPETVEDDGDGAEAHEGEGDLGDAAAPEATAEPATVTDEDVDDAPAPDHEPAVPAAEAAAVDEAEAEAETGDVPAEAAAPSADAVTAADEVSEADVRADEGDAPTVDQEPVSDESAPDEPTEAAAEG